MLKSQFALHIVLLCRGNNWDIKEIFFFLWGDLSPSALALHAWLGCGVRWSRGRIQKTRKIAWVEEDRDLDPLCCWIVELVLSGSTETGLHSSILPQTLYHSSQLCCHETLLSAASQHKQLPRIILRHRERRADFNFSTHTFNYHCHCPNNHPYYNETTINLIPQHFFFFFFTFMTCCFKQARFVTQIQK